MGLYNAWVDKISTSTIIIRGLNFHSYVDMYQINSVYLYNLLRLKNKVLGIIILIFNYNGFVFYNSASYVIFNFYIIRYVIIVIFLIITDIVPKYKHMDIFNIFILKYFICKIYK